MNSSQIRRPRADAQRSRAAILNAALRLLNVQPDASLEAIAAAAGVTRQTVYAHFPARRHLLAAVLDRVTEEAVEAMDSADPDGAPARDALLRLLDASARTAGRYRVVLELARSLPADPDADHARHAAVADRLEHVIRRGQANGEFDRQLSVRWLIAVILTLGHAAGDEVDSRRMSADEATDALHTSLLRVLGADQDHVPDGSR